MQNFGKIKECFNNVLSEGIITKNNDKKSSFKTYIKALKESEILKTQFLIYNNIESKVESNDIKINEYVKANIALMDKFNRKDIAKANSKLAKLVSLKKANGATDEINQLHKNISTLIFTKKNPISIDRIIDSTNNIVEYIKTNKEKVVGEAIIDMPISMTTAIFVEKFNSKYEDLDEDTVKLVKTILESNDEDKEVLFKDLHKECVGLVNGKLTESDSEDKETLLAVKEKLLNMEYITESDISNISDLIELKETLTE